MAPRQAPGEWRADVEAIDQELETFQRAVVEARANRWHGGDVIEPEFENFLAALAPRRSLDYGSRLAPGPAWENRKNSWREVLEQVG